MNPQYSHDASDRSARLVLRRQPPPADQMPLETVQRPLQAGECCRLDRLIVGTHAHPPQHQLHHRVHDLAAGEADPLADLGALGRSRADKLRCPRSALGHVLGNGVGFENSGSVGTFERRDLARWELGAELAGPVGLAHGEVGCQLDVEAVEAGGRSDL